MVGRMHEFSVTLHRDTPTEQWGFSLVGGSDVNTPLIVTKVSYRSPSDGVLQRGDIITKVGNYDARDIRHQDAQTLFSNAGNSMRIVVQRDPGMKSSSSKPPASAGSSTYSPLSVSPHMSPRAPTALASPSIANFSVPALQPYYHTPFTPVDHLHYQVEECFGGKLPVSEAAGDVVHVTNQPYRTTPLVLPGAKVKRDGGHTESYLRHHPNPSVRASPHQLIDHDHYQKKKVANSILERIQTEDPSKQIVHKQFNSPINVYSEPNIIDAAYKQAGMSPIRKGPIKYNPEESETYRAVKEETYGEAVHEVPVPPQAKIFAKQNPAAKVQIKKAGPVYSLPPQRHTNSMGEQEETIHQSGSFKRLMWSVMAESNY